MPRALGHAAAAIALALLLAGCAKQIPRDALQLSPTSLEDRQRSTRVFQTDDEAEILAASAACCKTSALRLRKARPA